LLESTKAHFILSSWHSNKYRLNLALEKYAQKFFVFTREHFYHVGASEKNRNPVLEALVLNYAPAPQAEILPAEQMALFEQKGKYEFRRASTDPVISSND